jgi:hypothetical protein
LRRCQDKRDGFIPMFVFLRQRVEQSFIRVATDVLLSSRKSKKIFATGFINILQIDGQKKRLFRFREIRLVQCWEKNSPVRFTHDSLKTHRREFGVSYSIWKFKNPLNFTFHSRMRLMWHRFTLYWFFHADSYIFQSHFNNSTRCISHYHETTRCALKNSTYHRYLHQTRTRLFLSYQFFSFLFFLTW